VRLLHLTAAELAVQTKSRSLPMGIGICDSDRSRNLRSASRLPSDLGVNLSYRGARRRGCCVIRFPGSSDGDRRSTARNGYATGRRAGAEALRVLALFCARLKACSPGLKSGASTDRKDTQAEAYARKALSA
jgi:hypothetical protein